MNNKSLQVHNETRYNVWDLCRPAVPACGFAVVSDVFLTPTNLLNILRQVSVVGICAVGMTLIIITGGIDLSAGSMIGLSGMICATLVALGYPPAVAFGMRRVISAGLRAVDALRASPGI
jgi:ribose/xylose/arabinose/galactoside ABC-type transport system permease subunit